MNYSLHYLLDTDMCIYLLNDHRRVKARVAQVGVAALAVAIPTVGELYFGAYNSGRVEANIARVRAFLSPPGPQVLLMDDPAAEQFGRLKANLRREGRLIGDIDLFIAGVALRHGLTVVTNNTGHFERIPELPLENWLEPPQASS
ncbi:MAG TPA: type II toxin-antitoxin system VapC family toxin [Alphaproteobacteria bacterium]|nr:type II toxin-antitoxin system VapC family toxin [Alphaproteobacteria bacterium]